MRSYDERRKSISSGRQASTCEAGTPRDPTAHPPARAAGAMRPPLLSRRLMLFDGNDDLAGV
jgi:hypothetical protein